MNMTDDELDRDWKPNGRRPQSTIARSFSQELVDIFRIDNSVADLDQQVASRKEQINTQTSELEALEARIREMEARLKQKPATDKPASAAAAPGRARGVTSPLAQRPGTGNANNLDKAHMKDRAAAGGVVAAEQASSRPGTAKQQHQQQQGGAGQKLPPTPVASEGDYQRLVPRVPKTGDAQNKAAQPVPELVATAPAGEPEMQSSHPSRPSGHRSTNTNTNNTAESMTSPPSSSSRPRSSWPLNQLSSGDDGGDAASTRSAMSGSTTLTDYVVVNGSDGDIERDA